MTWLWISMSKLSIYLHSVNSWCLKNTVYNIWWCAVLRPRPHLFFPIQKGEPPFNISTVTSIYCYLFLFCFFISFLSPFFFLGVLGMTSLSATFRFHQHGLIATTTLTPRRLYWVFCSFFLFFFWWLALIETIQFYEVIWCYTRVVKA